MEERDRENCISETLKLLFEGKLNGIGNAELGMRNYEFLVYLRRGMSVQHAAITANLNICKHCGLAFYYGKIHQKLEGVYFP